MVYGASMPVCQIAQSRALAPRAGLLISAAGLLSLLGVLAGKRVS